MKVFGGPQLSVFQCLHNIHRPGQHFELDHRAPGGAESQDAEELIVHLSGLPAGQEATPAPRMTNPQINVRFKGHGVVTLLQRQERGPF